VRKTITALSLVAALFAASTVPAASVTPAAPEPPAACNGLVADLAAKLKQTFSSLASAPEVNAAKPLIGDLLAIVAEMQKAGCLPALPVSAPAASPPVKTGYAAPADECLRAVLNLISGVAGLGGAVLGGADPAKINELLKALLATADDLLSECGLSLPPGGMPAASGVPLPVERG